MSFEGQITGRVGATPDACGGWGMATGEVIKFLDKGRAREAFRNEPSRLDLLPLTKLIGYLIDKHHVYARRQLAGIGALLANLLAAHERTSPELALVRGLFKVLRQELLFHMEKEEVSIFPHIIRAEIAAGGDEPPAAPNRGSVRDPLRMLMREHDELCAMLDRIRAATNDYTPPPGACENLATLYRALRDLELDLLQLVHLEDHILFPRALGMERPAGG